VRIKETLLIVECRSSCPKDQLRWRGGYHRDDIEILGDDRNLFPDQVRAGGGGDSNDNSNKKQKATDESAVQLPFQTTVWSLRIRARGCPVFRIRPLLNLAKRNLHIFWISPIITEHPTPADTYTHLTSTHGTSRVQNTTWRDGRANGKKLVAIGLRPLRPLKIAVSQKRFENTFRHYRLEVKQYFRLWRVVKVQGLPGRRWGGGVERKKN
jgi:hypothetical protein